MFLNSTKKTIVIAGAGFGGLRTALDLNSAFKKNPQLAGDYNLYLIDQSDHHLFTPSVYEAAVTLLDDAAAQKLKQAVAVPLEPVFKNGPLKFLQARILNFDPIKNKIILNNKTELEFDYLVMALGAETNFYNIPGLKEKALVLNNLNSAVKIRNEIEKRFCETLGHKKIFSVVFGGGGVTGVELAGEVCGYLKKLNKKYDAKLWLALTVIEGQKDILPGFDSKLVNWARKRLGGLGVKIETSELISEIKENYVFTKSSRKFQFDALVWSGGIKPNHLIDALPFKKDPQGRLAVGQNFCPVLEAATPETASECSNVLVIGDNCSLMLRGQPMPQTAQMAIDEGRQAARIILARLQNKPLPSYRPIPNRYILPIGGKFAIADLGRVKLKGFFIWLLKELVFLDYLISILPFPQALTHWLKALRLFIKND